MKSKTSPIIDSDTILCDGLREGLIVFKLLEMGAPNSSMVKSYGRLKIFATQGYCRNIRLLHILYDLMRKSKNRNTQGYCHVFGQGSC